MAIKFVNQEQSKTLEVYIYGVITEDKWFEDDVTPNDINELLKIDAELIDVYINSPGGSVFAGIAIMNMLRRHKALVRTTVDGIAASIASVILQAGDERLMYNNTMVMIHNPWTTAIGEAEDLRDIANKLDDIKNLIVETYVEKSHISSDAIKNMMDKETYMGAKEAAAYSFIDKIIEEKKPVIMDEAGIVFNSLRLDKSKYENIYKNSDIVEHCEPEPVDYSLFEKTIQNNSNIKRKGQ